MNAFQILETTENDHKRVIIITVGIGNLQVMDIPVPASTKWMDYSHTYRAVGLYVAVYVLCMAGVVHMCFMA